MKEKTFQTRLIKDAKELGYRIKKMQSGMGYIVLDVYVCHPMYGPQWWELKTIQTLGQKIGLTQLQYNEIEDEISAGGSAACITCYKQDQIESVYVTGLEETHVRPEHHIQDRRRGEKYDIDKIAREVSVRSRRTKFE